MARMVGVNRQMMAFVAAGFLAGVLAPYGSAQALAEAAGATSVTTSVVPAAPRPATIETKPASAPSAHIVATQSAATEEKNRTALEAKSGQDAARLLLRSTPSKAQVWVDGKAVGSTPLLLIVPPGKYKIEMRGPRQEHAERECALLPKETREEAVKLQQLYPNRVVSH